MLVILLVPLLFQLGSAAVDSDLITELPGINFQINFKQYSGYLQPDSTSYLHYWLVQSQNSPDNDPLLLWLNGGPGCSSMDGLFTENGPFRVTNINMTIEENVYAWNKIANVLYIESPTEVGFSYTTDPTHTEYGDNETALLNYNALKDFFTKYPEYNSRDFFISGESYAGIYLPTLAMYLIQDTTISKNFKGMAIGNGALSNDYLTNSVPPLMYEHVLVGERLWNNMTDDCCNGNGMTCDYVNILDNGGEGKDCFRQVAEISLIPQLASLDPYNIYDTCYIDTSLQRRKRTVYYKMFLERFGLDFEKAADIMKHAPSEMKRQRFDSTQQLPDCYYDGITLYLQRRDVRRAIHIPDYVLPWEECSNLRYQQQYADMAYQLKQTINANVRIMIYNGDCDTVCNAMGDKQFIDSLGRQQLNDTLPWYYKQDYQNENAGWTTLYDGIHFISVRGSGHFVPHDKPREALQMIANFIWNKDYSTQTGINVAPQSLLSTTPAPTVITTTTINNNADLITSLPGANFDIKFKQYSGYLQPYRTSFLHYWLVESQRNPDEDPLLLWLNGGPGCSSMDGLFTENGPFRVTNVNMTIEENVYAWNKIANVLYIESPTSVGFSYTTDTNVDYNDNETALLNYLALKDFFVKYPEYVTRDFFISGESYAGIYLPTLAMYLIQDPYISKIFKGMAIGNGYISVPYLSNAIPPFLYEHVLVGERIWNNMTADCCKGNGMKCDYYDILNTGGAGKDCFRQVGEISLIPQLASLDPYNIYDTCYVDTTMQKRKRTVIYKTFLQMLGLDFKKAEEIIRHAPAEMKRQRLDSTQQYPDCYYDGITLYLQRQDVREAIHIPDNVPAWEECVDFNYDRQYNDMAYQLKAAIDAKIRILIYNGDVDTVCNAMGDKQFIDSLGRKQINNTVPWYYKEDYENENAGWQTLYDGIHFISVRGSGHFVPHDKPREALQMITNFIWNKDYSASTGIDVSPQPVVMSTLPPASTVHKSTTPPASTEQAPATTSGVNSPNIRNCFWLDIALVFITAAIAKHLF